MSKSSNRSESKPADAAGPGGADPLPPRRHWFYSAAAVVIGGLVGVVPAAMGLVTFLDPWRRTPKVPVGRGAGPSADGVRVGGEREGFYRVASLASLSVGGAPQRFPIIADQLDSWNFSPQQPVGAVFLQRVSESTVRCFNTTCPHAGCSVAFDGQVYVCPCHNSSFLLDGQRRPAESGRDNPSPRDLDDLQVDSDKLAQGEIWVRFQNFYTGKHDPVPKA